MFVLRIISKNKKKKHVSWLNLGPRCAIKFDSDSKKENPKFYC